jgi:tripartite-type tricarboxylate transporter receptor subunit TctC
MTDLMTGRIEMFFVGTQVAAQQVHAGKLRALAVTGEQRAALLPDVPTYAEAKIPKASLVSWYAVAAPARTPEAIVTRLNRELGAVMAEPEVRQSLQNAGLEPVHLGPEVLRGMIRDEMSAFRAVAQKAQIVLD